MSTSVREARVRRHRRVRGKISGTAERPRLVVFRSNRGIFAQLDTLEPRPDVVHLPETALTGYFVEGGVRDLARTAGAMADDGELAGIVAQVIAENPDVVERIKDGNAKAMGALVGPIMKATRGRADGGEVNRLIRSQLEL